MPEWLTVGQAAEYLQVSEVTIRRWITEGKLRAYRFARLLRMRREDLDACGVPVEPGDTEGSADAP